MNIFIIYISIIGPQSCFDYTNFRVSLVIKIINLNEIKNMAHLTLLVIYIIIMNLPFMLSFGIEF
jgi:hypothetical protein